MVEALFPKNIIHQMAISYSPKHIRQTRFQNSINMSQLLLIGQNILMESACIACKSIEHNRKLQSNTFPETIYWSTFIKSSQPIPSSQ